MSETLKWEYKKKGTSEWVDISSFVVGNPRVELFRGDTKRIPNGNVSFDDSIVDSVSVEAHDSLRVTIVESDGTENVLPLFLFVPRGESNDEHNWSFEGYERLAGKRRASNVHVGKTYRQVFIDTIDEYLPELSYDIDSIPADSTSMPEQRWNAKLIKDVFDLIAQRLDRVWYVGNNKKIFLTTKTFADSGYEISDSEIIGRARKNVDVGNWQTLVRVEGASTETRQHKLIDVTDTEQTEYELDIIPKDIDVRITSNGGDPGDATPLIGAYAGTRRVADDNVEYEVHPSEKKIVLTSNAPTRTNGDDIHVVWTSVDQVVSEAINPVAYARFGLITGTPVVNELISSQDEADSIAQDLADARGFPLVIWQFKTVWNSAILPGNKVTFTGEGENAEYNTLSLILSAGPGGVTYDVMLNNLDVTAEDKIVDLMIRVRQLEEEKTLNTNFVKKTLLWYANVSVEVYRVRVKKETIGNAFTLDHADTGLDDATVFLDGVDGSGSLNDLGWLEVANSNDNIKLHFWDVDEWDLDNSTASLDASARKVSF